MLGLTVANASAEQTRWLADAYMELPWVVTVPGDVSASQGTADAFRVLLELECRTEDLEMVCTIEDAAFQGRATRSHAGDVGDELVDIRDGVIGAKVTMRFVEGGRLAVTPDLDDDDLTQRQRALVEQLISRALVGFDGVAVAAPELPTWIQEDSLLVQVPGTYAQGIISIRHIRDGDVVHSQGEGSTRTPAGTGFLLQMGAETRTMEGQLVDRWWWAAGKPMVSNATRAEYLQGGVLRRLEDGEHPLVGIGSGELFLEGPSVDAAVIGSGAYDERREFDLGAVPEVNNIWLRGSPVYRRRAEHKDTIGYELLVGYGLPAGLRLGMGYASHLQRTHDTLANPWPVTAHDLLVGAWYRPPEEPVAAHLGGFWGASFRDYHVTTPRMIWVPIGGAEAGIDLGLGRISLGAFVRLTVDGAATMVTHGSTNRIIQSFEAQAGIQATGRLLEW